MTIYVTHSWCLPWVVLSTVGLVGCTERPSSKPRIEAWSLRVESITAPSQRALLRCDPGGTACSAIADHEQVTSEALVRTESNAQARLTVPEHGKLWVDEQTELVLFRAEQPTLELRRGGVGAECVGTRALALRFLGYEARVDSILPTRFALQFRDPDQAEVTERTEAEFRAFFGAAGLRMTRVLQTASPSSLMVLARA